MSRFILIVLTFNLNEARLGLNELLLLISRKQYCRTLERKKSFAFSTHRLHGIFRAGVVPDR